MPRPKRLCVVNGTQRWELTCRTRSEFIPRNPRFHLSPDGRVCVYEGNIGSLPNQTTRRADWTVGCGAYSSVGFWHNQLGL